MAVELKQTIADFYRLEPENVLTGSGSSAMIDMLGLTFLDPGDEVLLGGPSYGAFQDMAWLNSGRPVEVPCTEEQKYDLKSMLEHVNEKTKMVIICNPNNPTGTYLPLPELEAFVEALPDHVLAVFDEAYMEFATKPDCRSMMDYMKSHPEKSVLILRTFSKYYAMAGLRVGYALGSGSDSGDAEMFRFLEPERLRAEGCGGRHRRSGILSGTERKDRDRPGISGRRNEKAGMQSL